MWLLELIMLSFLVGVPLGLGLRAWDEMMEKRKREQIEDTTPFVPETELTDKTESITND